MLRYQAIKTYNIIVFDIKHFTAHILIRYRWRDDRLVHSSSKSSIQGENKLKERVWTPHVYIVNEHDSNIMGSGRQDILVTVQPDGTVLYSARS